MILLVRWPNQQCHSTEGRTANPSRLGSVKGKQKEASNKFLIYTYKHHEDRRHRGAQKTDS